MFSIKSTIYVGGFHQVNWSFVVSSSVDRNDLTIAKTRSTKVAKTTYNNLPPMEVWSCPYWAKVEWFFRGQLSTRYVNNNYLVGNEDYTDHSHHKAITTGAISTFTLPFCHYILSTVVCDSNTAWFEQLIRTKGEQFSTTLFSNNQITRVWLFGSQQQYLTFTTYNI